MQNDGAEYENYDNHLDLLYRDIRIAGERIGYMHGIRNEICSKESICC